MNPSIVSTLRMTAATALACALIACSKPDQATPNDSAPATPDLAPPSPTGDAPAPTVPPPASEDMPSPPSDAPGGPAQPAPDAPSPADPTPAPQPTQQAEPPVETMQSARVNAKIGVPVDLRYSFEGDPAAGGPVRLHLAAVPRVAGGDMQVVVQRAPGLELSDGTLTVQKAAAAGVYRKQVTITPVDGAPTEIKVLVTMGLGEGSAHGFYSIPLVATATTTSSAKTSKQDSVKQE